tara:strand:- start:7543 stop:8481 length:939 start_codon:yes stop_codon:yes gene_type:complete
MSKKLISIVIPTFNEYENIDELYRRLINTTSSLTKYKFEILVIDNNSSDQTLKKLRVIAKKDKTFKVIVNEKNFGHLKSPVYGLTQTYGDATILMAADLQDPPENLPLFIKKWEEGFRAVLAVKKNSEESKLMFFVRDLYYSILNKISETKTIKNATGAGLFDKMIIDLLRESEDSEPYFRGWLCEITDSIGTVEFIQPLRFKGKTKNNLYSLFDLAMLGITNHSRLPLRFMALGGFLISLLSLLTAFFYLVIKLFFWESIDLGTAPILIGVFFFGALQAFFVGILGEYIGSIHSRVRKMPLVVEKERINFD